MYGKYVYTAAATMNNIIDDIAAIIAGQTNPASLIAAVSPDTQLDGTIATTWSVFDNATGSNNPRVILRSVISDAAGKYKYLGLGDSSGSMVVYTYESWNASTHAGTNAVSVTWAQGIGSSKTMTISANSKGAYISRPAVDSTTLIAGAVVTEFDRWDIWRTTAATYPDALLCYAGSGWGNSTSNGAPLASTPPYVAADRAKIPRVKKGNAAGDSVALSVNWVPVGMAFSLHDPMNASSMPLTRVRSADETTYAPTSPMGVGHWVQGFMGGMMSGYADVYWSTTAAGANFNELVVDSKTYVVNNVDANNVLLIRKV